MPTPDGRLLDLMAFLRGELARDEAREVVRHLLRAHTRRDSMTQKNHPAGDAEAAAQARLREIVEELKTIERELRAVHQSLNPPPEARTAPDVESEADERDVATEIRAVVECVLIDSLGPAIRDLQAAARYRAKA
jgi:hypothetical protein